MRSDSKHQHFKWLFAVVFGLLHGCVFAQQPMTSSRGSSLDIYLPVDDEVYQALDRLHGLGYLNSAFLGIRPWTKQSIRAMLDIADEADGIHDDPQAEEILQTLRREFSSISPDEKPDWNHPAVAYESVYMRLQGVAGLTLRDSFHLGQTISNDYGRPYQRGFNTVDGFGASAQVGRFSLYTRVEYQWAPAAAGYSPALFSILSNIDLIPIASNPVQATIPEGPIASANAVRIVEANVSYRLLNHQISFGKSDHWFCPDSGRQFSL